MPETVKIGSVLQPGEFTKIYQTREIYQVLTYSMDFKASGEIHWVRQYLINVVLWGIKNL